MVAISLMAGCVQPPDRIIVSYQQDPNDRADQRLGIAFSFPLSYGK